MAYLTIQQGVVLVYLHILQGADRTFFDVYRGVGALRFYLLHLDLKLLLGLGVRGGGDWPFLYHIRGVSWRNWDTPTSSRRRLLARKCDDGVAKCTILMGKGSTLKLALLATLMNTERSNSGLTY